MAVSSPLTLLSAAAVVVAGAAFVATDGPGERRDPAPTAVAAARSTPAAAAGKAPAAPARAAKKRREHVVRRGQTYVEVFNNSGISGLAGSTAARASGAGWQVVGTDNWYGSVEASTVYYPHGLRREAEALGEDLGIDRTRPVIEPMQGDRLTVILTADYG